MLYDAVLFDHLVKGVSSKWPTGRFYRLRSDYKFRVIGDDLVCHLLALLVQRCALVRHQMNFDSLIR